MRTNNEVKASDLRHRIIFFEQGLTSDGYGGYTNTPVGYYTCWAAVKNLSGTRSNSEDQMVIKNLWEILIRFNPSKPITKEMYISYNGKKLIIDSIIDENEYDRMIKILAKERD